MHSTDMTWMTIDNHLKFRPPKFRIFLSKFDTPPSKIRQIVLGLTISHMMESVDKLTVRFLYLDFAIHHNGLLPTEMPP